MNGSSGRPAPKHVVIQVDASFGSVERDPELIHAFASRLLSAPHAQYLTICSFSSIKRYELEQIAESLVRFGNSCVELVVQSNRVVLDTGAKGVITLAQEYLGREEILCAVKQIVRDRVEGKLAGPIDQEGFKRYLTAPDLPYPDLIIRTGSNLTLPNNLIWQMAYAEFWVSEKSWAELEISDLDEAIQAYKARERRFGLVIQSSA